jgi:hypothetical protein
MARILAVTWDGGGNVPPMLGVAAELRDRGHNVRVLGHPRQRNDVERAGLAFTPYAHALPWSPADLGSGMQFLRAYVRGCSTLNWPHRSPRFWPHLGLVAVAA